MELPEQSTRTAEARRIPPGPGVYLALGACLCLASPALHAQAPAPSEKKAAAGFRDRDYLAPRELDVRPQIRRHPVLKYPRSVPGQTTGRVVLRVFISARGRVDRISVVSAEPKGLFENSAIEGFSKARYDPGKKNGIAVGSQLTVEVNYTPESATKDGED